MTIPRLDRSSRNYLMNGRFDFAQRQKSDSFDDRHLYYCLDRWMMSTTFPYDAATTKVSQDSNPVRGESQFSIKFTGTPNLSDNQILLSQKIEHIFSQEFNEKPISTCFNVSSDSARKVSITYRIPTSGKDDYAEVNDYFTETFDISNDGSINVIKLENHIPLVSTKNGFEVIFRLHDFENLNALSTSFISSTKLNIGKTCQEFSYFGRDLIEEKMFCYRYFEVVESPITIIDLVKTSSSYSGGHYRYIAEKRVIPTVSGFEVAATNSTWAISVRKHACSWLAGPGMTQMYVESPLANPGKFNAEI